MKAIQYTAYGTSDVIRFAEVEKPVPKADEVLIKASATSLNPAEIKFRSGEAKDRFPIQHPYIPGLDVAGIVEAVGSDVARLKAGDKVYGGDFGGGYAQYVALKEEHVGIMPRNVGFNEAASLVVPLVTAYSFLIEHGEVKAGQRLLLHGAAGGTGSIVLQMAKALGLYVIASASAKGLALAKALGADELIDYMSQDFTAMVKDVDVVIAFAGGETTDKSFAVVKPGGKLFSAVAPPSQALAESSGVEAKFIGSRYSYKKLDYGTALVEAGKIIPRVVKTMRLEQAAEAQDLLSAGGLDGKIVLQID